MNAAAAAATTMVNPTERKTDQHIAFGGEKSYRGGGRKEFPLQHLTILIITQFDAAAYFKTLC